MGPRASCLLLALSLLIPAPLRAAVYSSEVTFDSSFGPAFYYVRAWSLPNQSGVRSSLEVRLTGNQLSILSVSRSISSSWFAVTEGIPVNPALVATGRPFVDVVVFPDGGVSTGYGADIPLAADTEFFLGFWIDTNHGLPNTFTGDRFGWAKFRTVKTGSGSLDFQLISSAIEDSGSGIYAGSLTVVPEPGPTGLLTLALLASRRQRGRHRLNSAMR